MTVLLNPPASREVDPRQTNCLPDSKLQLQVLPSSERTCALAAWKQLEADLGHGTPVSCSTLWIRSWLAHYGECVPHEFLIARSRQHVAGAALLTRGVRRRNGPFPWRTRHIGTAGEAHGESVCVEYNQLLAAPVHRMAFEEEVISHLLHDKSWDAFCLDGFAPRDVRQLLQDIPGAEIRLRDSPYYDLAEARGTQQQVLDRLGRSTRQNMRRLLRKYGELDIEWAENPEQAEDILSELIDLHQARWNSAGEPGAFHSSRFTGFQRRLVRDDFAARVASPEAPPRTVLFRVRHRGEAVGCLMLLCDRGRLLDYLSGFASFEAKASPGIVTHLLCMQEALRRGFDAYDFLVGDKRHKENLSTHCNQLAWATWTRPSFKSRAMSTLRSLKRRIRPPAAVRETPR